MTDKPKARRGFACLSPEQRSAIARKGGLAVSPESRSFSKNRALASAAGRLGGAASHGGGKPFHKPKGAA